MDRLAGTNGRRGRLAASLFAVICVAAQFAASGATYHASTTEELVALLKQHNGTSSAVIELDAKDYYLRDDLTWYTNKDMWVSHLCAEKLRIRGTGSTNTATRLIGTGNFRVIMLLTGATIENLTVTNGYAKTVSGYSNSNRGGGVYAGYVTNCLVIGNLADAYGGGGAGATRFYNSQIVNNRAKKSGGGFHGSYAYGSLIEGNVAVENGGGAFLNTGHQVVDCDVLRNSAGGSGGGIQNVGSVIGSRIGFNTANGGGGGLYGLTMVSNCVVYCNQISNAATTTSVYGGGIYGKSGGLLPVYDTEVYGNAALNFYEGETRKSSGGGGGVSCVAAYNCFVHDNYGDTCGGVHASTAYGCTVANNMSLGSGPNALASNLIGCDVSGTSIYGGTALNTKIHGIGHTFTPENPYYSEPFKSDRLWSGCQNATNCLITENYLPSNSMIQCLLNKDVVPSSLVNCTIASNICKYVFANSTNEQKRMTVVNTVFSENYAYAGSKFVSRDLSFGDYVTTAAFRMSRCAYGTTTVDNLADFVDDTIYRIGDSSSVGTYIGDRAGFCWAAKDPEHPFALRHSSCLRGLGAVQDWMEDATDRRGEGFARLRDGKVDLGCYQCWLNPLGMVFTVQ